jgi:D-aminoacyl-tRNA deacylase
VIAIVVSRADSASEHIGEHLLDLGDWERRDDPSRPDADGGGTYYRTDGFELREFDDLHIYLDDPAAAFGGGAGDETNDAASDDTDETPEFLAFVSRHSGETGELLTAHVTGNFGPAPYGGEPDTLARAAPGAEKRVVEALAAHAPEGYDVGIECTHHGPTDTSVPSLFVELGSDEPQWTDADAARAVARAVLDLRGTDADLVTDAGETTDEIDDDPHPRHVVGFGGGHYAPRFTRIVRETEWAVGHVGADWALGELGAPDANRDVIEQAFARSKANVAVIEGEKPDLEATVEALGHRVVSETWVRAVGDRPLPLVERLESDLATIDEGLRFGEVVPASPDAIRVRGLPEDLLSRAQGVDADAARVAVETNAVAFDTEQAGTRAAGSVAFADDEVSPGYDDLVADLAGVLERGYDTVDITDGAVIARETAFDPELAAKRGVPEGPAFGRLASGESVEVDGETIAPADVSRERTNRFPIDSPTDSAAEPPTEPSE